MHTTLNMFLALGFFFLFYHEIDGAVKCHICDRVKTDNSCFYKTSTCHGGYRDFCFTRRIIQGDNVIKIQRGCTTSCRIKVKKFHFIKEETLCCKQKLCNTHDLWPNPSSVVQLNRGPWEEVAGLDQRTTKHSI